jgi:predicted oxidoreductase
MFLQSKVGILKEEGLPMYYDLSYQHIIEGVNASLSRLHTTYLDCLLLHRPDIFMDSKEVAKAVNQLVEEGKIRHFGVSNEDASTIDYLQSELSLAD